MKKYSEIANEVINGLWGNGADRRARLEAAGYDYFKVQKFVNAILNGEALPDEDEATTDEFITVNVDLNKYKGIKLVFE